jgi:hypothetical protein
MEDEAYSKDYTHNPPVLVVNDEDGRVIFSSFYSELINYYEYFDNQMLLLNIIEWLSYRS